MLSFIRVSAILLALLSAQAYAESHALIMTIGEYTNGATPLEGSKYDIESARTIARKMGVKDANMRFYKDAQLTVAGMRKAFDELYQRVADNDQVFIYYSGHGGRWQMTQPDRCAVSLVAVDGEGFMDTDIQAELNWLAAKAQKIVMFADACHSGGVKTRAVRNPKGLTPRFWAKEGPDTCGIPVNIIETTLRTQARSIGRGVNNFVYIAAARENEVSWDMGKGGGAATQAWRDCIAGAAKDIDGSGGLSAEEIQQCAQEKINRSLKPFESQGVLPSHVTIAGNARVVLAFAESTTPTPTRPTPVAPAPTAPVSSAPPRPPTIVPVPTAPVSPLTTPTAPIQTALPVSKPPASAAPPALAVERPNPPAYYTLLDVYSNRDDRRVVTLTPAKSSFKIGQDVEFSLTSSHPGHVYLLMVGSDGKTFDMIFPNKIDTRNEIAAGQTLQLPRPAWQIKAGGPAGKNHLLVIVTDAPRAFSRIGMQPAGPFSVVEATRVASRDIQLVSNSSALATSAECAPSSERRTLQVQRRCSDAYGAALISIEEVKY